MPSLYEMAQGPKQSFFDDWQAGKDAYYGDQGNQFKLAELQRGDMARAFAGPALAGDQGAFSKLMQLDPNTGIKINDQRLQKTKAERELQGEDLKVIAGAVASADTPEKYQAAMDYLQSQGYPIDDEDRDFSNRQTILDATAGAGGGDYGLNLVYGADANGNLTAYQPSKSGALKKVQLPSGVSFAPGVKTIDTGTGTLVVDAKGGRAVPGAGGSPSGVVPKDIVGEQAAQAEGKDLGENRALLNSMSAKLPGLMKVVQELNALADEATYTEAGKLYNEGRKQFGLGPSRGAVARTEYASIVANQVLPLLRDTFGAQFTAAEGERLLATLGNPDVTPDEKKAVLNAFIEQKVRDIEGLSAQVGQQPQQSPQNPQGEQYFDQEMDIPDGAVVEDDEGKMWRREGEMLVPVQ